jgi:hypothetical protein
MNHHANCHERNHVLDVRCPVRPSRLDVALRAVAAVVVVLAAVVAVAAVAAAVPAVAYALGMFVAAAVVAGVVALPVAFVHAVGGAL